MQVQDIIGDRLFLMLYAAVATTALIACCYLLLRRANSIAPDVTPPRALRRWTAAFLAAIGLSHVWYLPVVFMSSAADMQTWYYVCAFIDYIVFVPLVMAMMLAMLQDRRRPLWPAVMATLPLVAGLAYYTYDILHTNSGANVPVWLGYLSLLAIVFIIYMVRAVRQYGRWLRDNYADLEHKEIWASMLVAAVMLWFFVVYSWEADNRALYYLIQVNSLLLTGFLVWRVETLSDLSASALSVSTEDPTTAVTVDDEAESTTTLSPSMLDNIGAMLHQHCIDDRLYLQHDLNLAQLAKAIGTNRYYLSQYFSSQGITYNAFINNLRINHFIDLYREAVASRRPFTAQQLAADSGYHSYSTFSLAFKQRMGQNVTTWMRQNSS